MVFPRNFEEKIDFLPLREHLRQYCVSEMGRDRVDRLRFFTDRDIIVRLLQQTDEMLSLLQAGEVPPLHGMHDCTVLLKQLQAEGTYATARQLYQISSTLRAAIAIRNFFFKEDADADLSQLKNVVSGFGDFTQILRCIDKVIDSVGEVKDNASEQLQKIRRDIASVQQSMSGAMRRAADAAIEAGVIDSDTRPVMRDGRLLLPLPATGRKAVPGIVYDRSATGKTVFVQPAEIIEAENRMHSLRADEQKEIVRILTGVADELRPFLPDMQQCWRILGIIDFIHAKAILAQDLDAQMPYVDDNDNDKKDKHPTIELYHALHPSLIYSLRKHKREAIPLDLVLDRKNRILMISGPNAGGKSVALKTVAVVQYMTQCGLLPTVRSNSHLAVFDKIFVDLGDEQSIQNDLSTFSSHLANMKYMMRHSDSQTLILIDEIGSGTEPVIGAALARSIMQEFVDKGAYGIVTTHYDSLKQYASQTTGMQNGAMMYDTEQMQPLYKLQQGMAGSSFALEIARKSGLPTHVINRAAKDVGRDYTDSEKYIQQIARDRKQAHIKKIEIERLEKELIDKQQRLEAYTDEIRSKRAELIGEARQQAEQLLSGANAEIERTIREIRTSQADKEKTKEVRQQLLKYRQEVARQNQEEKVYAVEKKREKSSKQGDKSVKAAIKSVVDTKSLLQPGDYVKSDNSSMTGQIISIQGDTAEVAFGSIRMKVKTSRLTRTAQPKTQDTTGKYASLGKKTISDSGSRQRQLQFTPNIDVRGMTVDEAMQAVTYFIDDAAQFEVSPVRILHGTGTGALRSALRQYLRTMPVVENFHDEDVRLGGAGITVVELNG